MVGSAAGVGSGPVLEVRLSSSRRAKAASVQAMGPSASPGVSEGDASGFTVAVSTGVTVSTTLIEGVGAWVAGLAASGVSAGASNWFGVGASALSKTVSSIVAEGVVSMSDGADDATPAVLEVVSSCRSTLVGAVSVSPFVSVAEDVDVACLFVSLASRECLVAGVVFEELDESADDESADDEDEPEDDESEDDDDDESDDDDPDVSADAVPQPNPVRTAVPIPRATASPPTLPT